MSKSNQIATTKPILWIGFFIGAIASWGVLSGDQQGQVNILFLLLIYVALPILSLLISSLSLVFGNGLNLAKLTSILPIWSDSIQSAFVRQKQTSHSKLHFFYQSQLAALSFSLASVAVLLILLLTTDVNFIWRSTLLTARDIYPLLNAIAWPWQFWADAQPDLNLLVASQDSRLVDSSAIHFNNEKTGPLGNWWQFILATQLVYALTLRGIAIVVCKVVWLKIENQEPDIKLVTERKSQTNLTDHYSLVNVIDDTQSDFALTNWAGIEEQHINAILNRVSHIKVAELKAGPLASEAEQLASERWQEPQLLIVKGWEPPLGELFDYMQNGNGYLLPLDWNNHQLIPLSSNYLAEWRRFAEPLSGWHVLQLEH
jgi:hypothetical protein